MAGGSSVAERPAGARLHFIGGGSLDVVQGAAIANNRLETASEGPKPFASLTEPRGKAAFVNPRAVTHVEQIGERRHAAQQRDANARVCFIGGTAVDVLQGSGVVNKRLEESLGSHGLFATLTDTAGRAVFVNHGAVTHVTSHLNGDASRSADLPA